MMDFCDFRLRLGCKWKGVGINYAGIFEEGFAKEVLSFAAFVEGPARFGMHVAFRVFAGMFLQVRRKTAPTTGARKSYLIE